MNKNTKEQMGVIKERLEKAASGAMSEKGRVVFLLKLKPGMAEQFLEAYEGVRHEVAGGVKGHIVDQVCQSPRGPRQLADHERVGVGGRLLRVGGDRGASRPGQADARLHGRGQVVQVRRPRGDAQPGEVSMIKRGCIVAKIKPGAEEEVAKLFAESDESELPRLAGVRHRSLFVLDDVYVHYVETDDDFAEAVDAVRDHPLFKEISRPAGRLHHPVRPRDLEVAEGRAGARVLQLGSARVGLERSDRVGGRELGLRVDLPDQARQHPPGPDLEEASRSPRPPACARSPPTGRGSRSARRVPDGPLRRPG